MAQRRGRLGAFLDWAKWEFDRPIEVTLAIRLITIERFVKGGILIIGGIALLVLSSRSNVHRMVQDIQNQLVAEDKTWWRSLVLKAMTKVGHFSGKQIDAVAIGVILYGCLEAFEGFGLLLKRRWAEYLVLIATAAFLPLEIEELLRGPTAFKIGAFIINVAIVIYLVWRKRLFLDRRSDVEADKTWPAPGQSTPRATDA